MDTAISSVLWAAERYPGVNSYEHRLLDLLDILRSGRVERAAAVDSLIGLTVGWPVGSLEILEYTMRELQWPEVRDALFKHLEEAPDFRTRKQAERALLVYEDRWEDGDIYVRYSPTQNRPLVAYVQFIHDHRRYLFRTVSRDRDVRVSELSVELNGAQAASMLISGWRPLSFGSSDLAYVWSARELVILPASLEDTVDVLSLNEDIASVFRLHDGWVVVCDSSVRRYVGDLELERIEFDGVALSSQLEGRDVCVDLVSGDNVRVELSL
ncbi:hypothetical protein [Agromyces mediolanus]|uniref:hypothetical protein n=1 Tax=Agromyces mediolanus TaxID=41986 RepID=UPI001E2E8FBC|nr:hypothetical protein [Agromyces mediolanus]MCD1573373.1 hypothetical protein [Agromyces mediolanus]